MKKRFLIPTIAGLAMLGLIAFGLNLAQKPSGRLTVSYAAESELPPGSIIPTTAKDAAGTVIDYAGSLAEMAQNADLIVVAKVTDQQQFSYVSVASTAQPLRVLKGSAPSVGVNAKVNTFGRGIVNGSGRGKVDTPELA